MLPPRQPTISTTVKSQQETLRRWAATCLSCRWTIRRWRYVDDVPAHDERNGHHVIQRYDGRGHGHDGGLQPNDGHGHGAIRDGRDGGDGPRGRRRDEPYGERGQHGRSEHGHGCRRGCMGAAAGMQGAAAAMGGMRQNLGKTGGEIDRG
ncbi:hypothetical protein EDB83DRAFT_2409843 [Lactarius deliciosus]|nr:hypothetical protein EDB83DRAFT_2409843 [Lactarius deliciosus]